MNDLEFAAKYLAHYGYLSGAEFAKGGPLQDSDISAQLSQLQAVGGLDITGELDAPTIELMKRPRCGCTDVQRIFKGIEFAKWRKNPLTFYVATYVHGLSVPEQDAILIQAWEQWEAVAGIQLVKVDSPQADIVISTGRGGAQNFDGPSGTLAWAFLPNGSDQQLLMRFDLDETWVKDNPGAGILLLNVACHEFGHLLGLDHSRMPTALMAPFYKPSIFKPQPTDDIPRIQALYGPPVTTQPPVPPTVPPTVPPSQPPGVPPMNFPLDAIRQILAFFNGTDKSLRKLVKAVAVVATFAADYLPDSTVALLAEPLPDDLAIGFLQTMEAAATSEAQAALNIPWTLLLKWLFSKLAGI